MVETSSSCCRIYHGHGELDVLRSCDPVCVEIILEEAEPTIASRVLVGRIMTREVVCARRDLRLGVLIPLLVRNRIGCIPIVDDEGHPIGMVTKQDLVEQLDAMEEGIPPARTAEDLMMPLAMTLDERATVAHAAAMMALEDVHHILVVAPTGVLLGIVSTLDIVRWLAHNDGLVTTRDPAEACAQPIG